MLWQWAEFRIPQGRQKPDHIKYQKADPVPKVTDLVTNMMTQHTTDAQGIIHLGSTRAAQGDWAGDNWLKLHHMENVITRRGEYNQEIF